MQSESAGSARSGEHPPPTGAPLRDRLRTLGSILLLIAVAGHGITALLAPHLPEGPIRPLIDTALLTLVTGAVLWWMSTRLHRRGETRRAQAAMSAAHAAEIDHARFEMTLAIGNIGAWELDPSTGAFLGDSRWAQIFGFSPLAGSIGVEAAVSRLHPDDREGAWLAHEEHRRERTPYYEYRFRIRQADGSYRWAISRGCIVERDAENQALRTIGVTIDIHEQAMREEREREARALLVRIMELIPYSVFWKDRHSVYLGCNDAFARNAGLARPADIVGLTDYDMPWSGSQTEAYRADDARVMASGEARMHIQEALTTSEGGTYWIDTSKVALRDPEGNLLGVLGIFADVTEQRTREIETQRLRAAAEAANRAKSEFLANMSHEIRTPLAAILGYADVLRDEVGTCPEGARHTEAIQTIRRAGEHLLTVVNDVLDLSKIEAGYVEVECEVVDLPELIAMADALLQSTARGKGIELHTELDGPIPSRVLVDPTRLRQILLNMIGNAIKFTELGSVHVTVRSEPRERAALLCVDIRDTGVGISDEWRDRLFEPFTQADASLTRRYGGTGLGLVIARRLARLLGGDVLLMETERGKGSWFRVQIECGAVADAAAVQTFAASPSGSAPPDVTVRAHVLYAEDAPINQRLIARILVRAGARVDIAENGCRALECLRAAAEENDPYDLLVTDIQMPEMDGYTLVRTLRAEGSNLPILALTAHAMAEDRDRCLEAGCDAYLSKPIERAAFLRACHALLAARGDEAAA